MGHLRVLSSIVLICFAGCSSSPPKSAGGVLLNDVHSRLNATRVEEVVYPESTADLVQIVRKARRDKKVVSISGGRHAMGGQQFGQDTLHISMSKMNDVISFDRVKGIVRVEAGIEWPTLMEYLLNAQKGDTPQWGITQKQTGADRLSIVGALSANVHGRGVRFKPIIQDVESFALVNADGELLTVSRDEHPELFRLAIGAYGLFGVIATVDLRLSKRLKVERVVEVISIDELPAKTRQRLEGGFLYGDFQYKTDEKASDFMEVGVFSTYKPVSDDTPMPEVKRRLTPEKWRKFMLLAHTDKSRAFEFYSSYYLTTNGNLYWSDTSQMSFYDDQYLDFLKAALPKDYPEGSLMITEVYVPRERINEFIRKVEGDARTHGFNIIYGTMRLIERDDESYLAWAKQNYACVIFNLRVEHSEARLEKAKHDFQIIIDDALELDGSYYLTYHRWARKDQVLRAYPQFPEFLKLKLRYDPEERFQSEWYRHYKNMFASELGLALVGSLEK